MAKGLLINLDRCTGCDSCIVACKLENRLPLGSFYNKVIAIGPTGTFPDVEKYWLPSQCQQCENPQCVSVCPTGATYKDDKGRVEIDYDKCMACLACVNACPYGMRDQSKLQPRLHQFVRKCTFCRDHRAADPGAEPYCVATCHQRARIFGDIDDPESEVSRLINTTHTERLFTELGTDPQIYYIPELGGKA